MENVQEIPQTNQLSTDLTIAEEVLAVKTELKQTKFEMRKLQARYRVLTKVGDTDNAKALVESLTKVEMMIAEYETIIAELEGNQPTEK